MLRNKVGIKKMIALIDGCRDSCCSSEYAIRWIRKSRRRSKDPRRDEKGSSRLLDSPVLAFSLS